MSQVMKRAIVSLLIFVIVYFGASLVTGIQAYKTLDFMSAIIAAGCYWIGSNQTK